MPPPLSTISCVFSGASFYSILNVYLPPDRPPRRRAGKAKGLRRLRRIVKCGILSVNRVRPCRKGGPPLHNTIAVAMSGGVDSSVAVWLLRQEGWETAGVTLRLFQPEDLAPGRGEACHALQDAEDARAVAAQLGIPHYTLDLSDRFAQWRSMRRAAPPTPVWCATEPSNSEPFWRRRTSWAIPFWPPATTPRWSGMRAPAAFC